MTKPTKLKDWMFRQVHHNNLVYNTCWEDPRCDRQLMDFGADSQIVMITSAGCNALDYLTQAPQHIHCVDMNPRQNALLALKLAAFQNGSYSDLYQVFGEGVHQQMPELYRDALRRLMPGFAQAYWDENLHFFNGKGLRKSFYHHGTSGTFAWIANQYFRMYRSLHDKLYSLFEASDLEEQAEIYKSLEPKVLSSRAEWIVNQHLTMCLLGVPESQQRLFVNQYERGAMGFIQQCLRHVFTSIPVRDNYFWRLYLAGKYEKDCCPSYLEEANFDTLAAQHDKVSLHTTTMSQFLKDNPNEYSHYVLLDHQDWLAANNIPALEEEWHLILQNSRPGTKILLRSAAVEVDFFPDFVKSRVNFENEKVAPVQYFDRVGTYASTYVGVVQ